MKESESMSIPVIGGAGSWGNNIPGIEEDPSTVSHVTTLYGFTLQKQPYILLMIH